MNVARMSALAKKLALPAFDLMLVADGSGRTAGTPCGWSCHAYEPAAAAVEVYAGGSTHGTNNYAELMPFVQALWAYDAAHPFARRVRVAAVSDSEVTVRGGTREYGRNANRPLWASLEWFEGLGWVFHWRHIPRNSDPVHEAADDESRTVRLMFENYLLSDATSCLPSEGTGNTGDDE